MIRNTIFLTLAAACALSACAASPGPEAGLIEPRVADTRQARLADATARELAHMARFDPQGLQTVQPELRALAAALAGRDLRPGEEAIPAPAAPPAPPPAPDMSAAPSLLHAVHLASYRREATARAGWDTLLALHPDRLTGLEARLEPVDLGERGLYLRLKAGPFDSAAEARGVCAAIAASGAYCQPDDFTGSALGPD